VNIVGTYDQGSDRQMNDATAALAGERLAQVGVLKKVAFAGASHAMTSRYRAGQHDR
jgi:hypothetical protein